MQQSHMLTNLVMALKLPCSFGTSFHARIMYVNKICCWM